MRWRTLARSSQYRWMSLPALAWKSVGSCQSMSALSFSGSSWWYYLWSSAQRDALSSWGDLNRPKETPRLALLLLCSSDCSKVFRFPKLVVSQSVRSRTSCFLQRHIKWRFFWFDLCVRSLSWTFGKSQGQLCCRCPLTMKTCLCWSGHHPGSLDSLLLLNHRRHQTQTPQESQLYMYK